MNNIEIVHGLLTRCREAVETRDWVSPTMEEVTALSLLLCAPAVRATADADGAAKEIVAGDLFDPEHTGWSLNKSVPIEVVTERISAIIRKAVSPKAAAETLIK